MLYRPWPVRHPVAIADAREVVHNHTLPFRGKRVPVIEARILYADDLRRMLSTAGALVVGPLSTLSRTQQALDEGALD